MTKKCFVHMHLAGRTGCFYHAINGRAHVAVNDIIFAEAVDVDKVGHIVMIAAMVFGPDLLLIDTIPCEMPELLTRVMETHK